LFFSLVVIKPVHYLYPDHPAGEKKGDPEGGKEEITSSHSQSSHLEIRSFGSAIKSLQDDVNFPVDYLWMYLVFAYVFTGVLLYLVVSTTKHIIDVRQKYLGTQSDLTSRTFRLSGIPEELRSEDAIKNFVEELEIGKVESVTLIKEWKELDEAMADRMAILRKLEASWTLYLKRRRADLGLQPLPSSQTQPRDIEGRSADEHESSRLLNGEAMAPDNSKRPTKRIWINRLKFQFRKVDAIDYYEEKLKKCDEKVVELRKQEFKPTGGAFVTMDSVASCQMAAQAVLDPLPLQLIAKPSPAPTDVIWQNTYIPRRKRMVKSWLITAFIVVLTVLWSAYLGAVAGALNPKTLKKAFPGLGDYLMDHPTLNSLVQTQLTTALAALLTLLVPYFYQWLASIQGMISQGEVELSLISKNFFFTFVNFFIVFTLFGTASNFIDQYDELKRHFKDTSLIGITLAKSLQSLLKFYNNFVILQGLGLLPFRLLEIGSVVMYPIQKIGSRTPRDFAELVQPPEFSYGFFLPQIILIFIICVVYSVLRDSWKVLLSGLAYFLIGRFVYKYQLLYAMDTRQHSTGGAWPMICDRVIAGLILFQLTMAGQLAFKKSWNLSIAIVPLLIGTAWFVYAWSKAYKPLMKFIALKSIREAEHTELGRHLREVSANSLANARSGTDQENSSIGSGAREKRYVNPSLVMPLDNVWITDQSARLEDGYEHAAPGEGLSVS
jgi:hypothetical protein